MTRQVLEALLVAGVVLLAGCVGGIASSPGSPTADAPGTDASPTPATADAGTVAFYVSDERNAIDDFEHLNVTVTRVGFERAATAGGGWVEREVDGETIDLTELQGANATLLGEYDVPNGTYGTVFVHVGEVNATLENGERVRVKLPSGKLQVQKGFTVDNGSQVDFVFDITVHEAGKSGKYILKPVVTESGTDVPIESPDEREETDGEDERGETGEKGEKGERDEKELTATFVGNVSQGESTTVEVTRDGEPVTNATVVVNDRAVGTTDADGRSTFEVPREEEVNVEVTKGDAEAELEVEFETDDADESRNRDDESGDREAEALTATFVGNVSQGETATVSVTRNGSAVANATVAVNDEVVGTTDADGELAFAVPTAETLTVIVRAGDEEVELEREFEDER